MHYRPDIDGLRAIAVLGVVLYHASQSVPGGYVGVDIFFVISGFLISQLLVKEIDAGQFTLLRFAERRVRRLVPALFSMTIVTAALGAYVLLPMHLSDLGGALVTQPLLVANLWYWRNVKAGYFADPPEIRPLLHTWSLGVEEQFYVFFPLLLLFAKKRWRWPALISVFLVSLALSVGLVRTKSVFCFFMLPTRAWELILGALINRFTSIPPTVRNWLGVMGFFATGYSLCMLDASIPFPGWAALLPTCGTALLILSGPDSWTGRIFSAKPLVFTGQLSYSLYLWHWPCLALENYLLTPTPATTTFACLLSYALAYLSWRWIETPFRNGKHFRGRRPAVLLFSAYALFCFLAGSLFLSTSGLPQRWPNLEKTAVRTYNFEFDPKGSSHPHPLGSGKPAFLLWGDSHAMSLAPAFDQLAKKHSISGLQLTRSACPPLLDWSFASSPHHLIEKWPAEIPRDQWCKTAIQMARENEIQTIVMVGFWELYTQEDLHHNIRRTAQTLLEAGFQVLFVEDVPRGPALPRVPAFVQRWPGLWTEIPVHIGPKLAPSGLPGLTSVELGPAISKWTISTWSKFPYDDDNHLSDFGALQLAPTLEPKFLETLKSARQ